MESKRGVSSMVEQVPFKHLVGGSNPSRLTKKEIESEVGAALAAEAVFCAFGTLSGIVW